jgi:hypothetical protein
MVVGFSPVSAIALNARKSDLISLFVRKTDCSHEKLPPLLKTQSICHNPTRMIPGEERWKRNALSQTRHCVNEILSPLTQPEYFYAAAQAKMCPKNRTAW